MNTVYTRCTVKMLGHKKETVYFGKAQVIKNVTLIFDYAY